MGSAAVLPCLASGFPVPEISWSKVSRDAGTRGCAKAGMGALWVLTPAVLTAGGGAAGRRAGGGHRSDAAGCAP